MKVDGKTAGTTPQVGLVLDAGRHTVTLTNPEFGLERVITVSDHRWPNPHPEHRPHRDRARSEPAAEP